MYTTSHISYLYLSHGACGTMTYTNQDIWFSRPIVDHIKTYHRFKSWNVYIHLNNHLYFQKHHLMCYFTMNCIFTNTQHHTHLQTLRWETYFHPIICKFIHITNLVIITDWIIRSKTFKKACPHC